MSKIAMIIGVVLNALIEFSHADTKLVNSPVDGIVELSIEDNNQINKRSHFLNGRNIVRVYSKISAGDLFVVVVTTEIEPIVERDFKGDLQERTKSVSFYLKCKTKDEMNVVTKALLDEMRVK